MNGGNQTLNGTALDDSIYDDVYSMIRGAHGGMDVIYGGAGNDNLFRDAYEMHNTAQGGDYLSGGTGNA